MARLNAELGIKPVRPGGNKIIKETYVVSVAEPEVASVPPWTVVKNCEVGTPRLAVKY